MAINERNYVGYDISPKTGRPHRIRHLPKMAEWEPGVYLYEPGDKFVAGIDGIDNLPTQQLANRTEFLYRENRLLGEACRGLVSIVKEVSRGKTSINGYRTALSRDRPDVFCAWVKPQDSLGTAWDIPPYILSDDGTAYQNPPSKIVTEHGMTYYVGGDGRAFPRIIKLLGTVGLVISRVNLMQGGAWVRPSEDIGQDADPSSRIVLEDGTVMENPTAMIVNENDEAYYIQTFAPDDDSIYDGNIYDEVIEAGFDIATHGDVDALLARD